MTTGQMPLISSQTRGSPSRMRTGLRSKRSNELSGLHGTRRRKLASVSPGPSRRHESARHSPRMGFLLCTPPPGIPPSVTNLVVSLTTQDGFDWCPRTSVHITMRNKRSFTGRNSAPAKMRMGFGQCTRALCHAHRLRSAVKLGAPRTPRNKSCPCAAIQFRLALPVAADRLHRVRATDAVMRSAEQSPVVPPIIPLFVPLKPLGLFGIPAQAFHPVPLTHPLLTASPYQNRLAL